MQGHQQVSDSKVQYAVGNDLLLYATSTVTRWQRRAGFFWQDYAAAGRAC